MLVPLFSAAVIFAVSVATISLDVPISGGAPSTSFTSTNDYASQLLQFYSEDPSAEDDRRCLSMLEDGISIDVIIDIANSPDHDDYDQLSARTPPKAGGDDAAKVERDYTAQTYFDSIALFLDMLQVDIDPSRLYSVLIDKGQKYYIGGKRLNRTRSATAAKRAKQSDPCFGGFGSAGGDSSRADDIQMTSLGTLTKLALQARDNGLPIVLRNSKSSITLYSVLVTDGASGLPALFFSQDRSKTTIIDIGKRRFLSRMSYNSFIQYADVISLQHPQQLLDIVATIRFIACKIVGVASGARK